MGILKKKYLIIFLCLWLGAALLLTLWPYNITFHNSVAAPAEGGLHFKSPSIAYLRQPPQKLCEMKKFSMVAEIKPDNVTTDISCVIFGYSYSYFLQNFLVMQNGSSLGFFLTDKNELHKIWIGDIFEKDQSGLISITYDSEKITILKNGSVRKVLTAKDFDFSCWDRTFDFVFANTGSGSSPWSGTIYSLDIFDSVVTISNSRQLGLIRNTIPPVLSLSFHHTETESSIKNRDSSLAALVIPAMYNPPAKGLIFSILNSFDKGKRSFSNIFLNTLFFVPLGLFLRPLLEMYTKRYSLSFWLTLTAGLMLTIIIESLQILLPARDTSIIDVLCNTLGTVAGSSLFTFPWIRKLFNLESRYK
jgi:hypothetical protein